MIALALPLLLSATPSIAVTEFSRVNVTPELTAFMSEQVSQRLLTRGFKVVTSRDIATVLGNERQKELLGCAGDKSECMAELAAALGSDFLLSGTVAKLGSTVQLSLKVLDAKTGTPRASFNGSVRDEAELPKLAERGADELSEALLPRPPSKPLGAAFWVPMIGGAALLGGGATSFVISESAHTTLTQERTTPLSSAEALAARDRGQVTQILGPVLTGAGVAAIGVAVVLAATGAASPPAVSLSVSPQGAALTVGGTF